MCEILKHHTAVAAQAVNDTVIDGFFSGGEYGRIKVLGFFNGIKVIIPVTEVYVFIGRAVNPCLTIFFEKEFLIKGKIESLNIIERFLQSERSNILAPVQQISDFLC